MSAHIDQMRALYGPTVADRTADLVHIGEAISTQLVDLARDPNLDRCQHLAGTLYGARLVVMKLAERLRQDGDE